MLPETLAIAVKAFQGQLEVCSKQHPGKRQAGYRSFPGKHRLEFQPGAAHAREPAVLQGLTTMVRLCEITLHNRAVQQQSSMAD